MKHAFPALITEESENAYLVNFRDLPDCFTEGETLEHAIDMAHEVLELMLEYMRDEGITIPEPSEKREDEIMICVDI